MSSVRTRGDLVLEALANLGVLQAGQTPADEDVSFVDVKVETVLADLMAREIVYVPDPDTIPQTIFGKLADILADSCKTKFGVSSEDATKLEGARIQAELDLRVIMRGRPTYEVLAVDFV
jgi:hypothetical protein